MKTIRVKRINTGFLKMGVLLISTDYLELVDWTGRSLREDKRGAIDETLPPILERLNVEPKHWLYLTKHFESRFKGLVGTAYQLKRICEQLGYQRVPGIKNCKTYFP